MQIVSRAQWGARPPKCRVTGDKVLENYLHHTAGGHKGAAGMRSMQNFHMDSRGWCDVAYNFVVDPADLKVYEGRGWGVRPGSQKGYNARTWSVCIMGNFQTLKPTQGLLDVIAELISHGASLGRIPRLLTGGHRDAPNQSTSCPGTNLYAAIPTIRTLIASTPEEDMTPEQAKKLDEIHAGLSPLVPAIRTALLLAPIGKSGKNLAQHLQETRNIVVDIKASPVDPAAVAALIAGALGPEVGGIVAAELAKLTLKAT